MKQVINLINALIISFWLIVVAVLSIQNVDGISLKFLVWQSIEIPLGVLLSFALGCGVILGAIFPWFSFGKTRKVPRNYRRSLEREEIDYREEDPLEDWEQPASENW